MLAHAIVGGGLFDRYTWPVALVLLIVVLHLPRHRPVPTAAVVAGVALLSSVSLLTVVEEYTYDVARWEAGEAAVATGIPATSTDAGFEWVGYHYEHPAFTSPDGNHWGTPRRWYNRAFPGSSNCALVALSPLDNPGPELIERRPYRSLIVAGQRSLWPYRNPPVCEGG